MDLLSSRATGIRAASILLIGAAAAGGAVLCAVALLAHDRLAAGVPVALVFYPLLWAGAIALHRRVRRAARHVTIDGDVLQADLGGHRVTVPLRSIARVEPTSASPTLVRVVLSEAAAGATELCFFARCDASTAASDLFARARRAVSR